MSLHSRNNTTTGQHIDYTLNTQTALFTFIYFD